MQTFMSLLRNNKIKLQRFNKFKTDIMFLFSFDIVELLLLELLVKSFYANFVAETFLVVVDGGTYIRATYKAKALYNCAFKTPSTRRRL